MQEATYPLTLYQYVRTLLSPLSYRSEYRLRFRPFTQYEYIGDRFVQSQASLVAPVAASNSAGAGDEESAAPAADMVASARSLHGDPWFTEVIELRKRAKDYMVREHARALHALSCRAPF